MPPPAARLIHAVAARLGHRVQQAVAPSQAEHPGHGVDGDVLLAVVHKDGQDEVAWNAFALLFQREGGRRGASGDGAVSQRWRAGRNAAAQAGAQLSRRPGLQAGAHPAGAAAVRAGCAHLGAGWFRQRRGAQSRCGGCAAAAREGPAVAPRACPRAPRAGKGGGVRHEHAEAAQRQRHTLQQLPILPHRLAFGRERTSIRSTGSATAVTRSEERLGRAVWRGAASLPLLHSA